VTERQYTVGSILVQLRVAPDRTPLYRRSSGGHPRPETVAVPDARRDSHAMAHLDAGEIDAHHHEKDPT